MLKDADSVSLTFFNSQSLFMIDPALYAKIKWHCRRGMLELDVILARFVEKKLMQLNQEELLLVQKLLMEADPDLYAWFMGLEQPKEEELKNAIALVQTADTIRSI